MRSAPCHTPRCVARGETGLSGLDERQGSRGARNLELISQQMSLPVRECPQCLRLGDVIPREELPAPRGTPPTLAHQQLPNGPAERLIGRLQDDLRGGSISLGNPSLQLRAREPDRVGSFQCSQSLRRWDQSGGLTHLVLRFLPLRPRKADVFYEWAGVLAGPLPWVLSAHCYTRTHTRTAFVAPVRPFPTFAAAFSAWPFR